MLFSANLKPEGTTMYRHTDRFRLFNFINFIINNVKIYPNKIVDVKENTRTVQLCRNIKLCHLVG